MYVDELKPENLYFDRKRNHCDKASIKLLNRPLILISLFFKAAHATTTIHVYVHMYSTDVHHRWHPCDHGALNHTVASTVISISWSPAPYASSAGGRWTLGHAIIALV